MEKCRRKDIDLLKGIAVIGVFFYHFGICRSGYLGVDVFLVISGFLTIPKIVDLMETDNFHYIRFIKQRLIRLWPLTILVAVLTLLVGYFMMMPVDYQNLAENALATFFFSNNLLQYFLGGNYWDIRNDFKPLMHTWYLGVLFAFYIFIPALLLSVWYLLGKKKSRLKITLMVCTLLSFLLFLFPLKPFDPFYFLHTRLFEFTIGGLAGLGLRKTERLERKYYIGAYLILLLIILFGLFSMRNVLKENTIAIGAHIQPQHFSMANKLFLPMTVFLTAFILHENIAVHRKWKILSYLGTRSFEIFLWQQPIFAFYRYFIDHRPSIVAFAGCTLLTILLSEWAYDLFEKKLYFKKKIIRKALLLSTTVSIFCFAVYKNSGVVRDIPELDVKAVNVPPHFNTAYIDRIYVYQADFTNTQTGNNVLLVGNSFARDFGNILLESVYGEQLNISYYPDFVSVPIAQMEHCDYLFDFGYRSDIPKEVWKHLKNENQVYGIGTKSFGMSNGYVYAKRYTENYYETTIPLSSAYIMLNEEWKKEWGKQYIDLIAPIEAQTGEVYAFTPDHKLFSHDCRHLTRAGAMYYARILPLDIIFEKGYTDAAYPQEINHENIVCGNGG